MRKAARLFEIIELLRGATKPTTAAELAEALEVVPRTVYRDIAVLQARRVPIEGDRGIGYILRPGFNLPPLMFSIEETEAIVLALRLLERTGDGELKQAGKVVNRKVAAAVPLALRKCLFANTIHAWGTMAAAPPGIDLALVRRAVRDEQKLSIGYHDEQGRKTKRTIWPIALIYYSETANIVAWCELRQAMRNFRSERVQTGILLEDFFRGEGDKLRREWIAGWKTQSA